MRMLYVALAVALAGCSQIVGFKDPKLDDMLGTGGPDAAVPDAPPAGAQCKPADCPFGCDPATDRCRPAKLWVYLSKGAFNGAGFGGQDTPPNPRGGADAQCGLTLAESFPKLACNPKRVHAVLNISSGDSIGTMATQFTIPTDAPVHRPSDDVLVADTWLDLTATKSPRVAVLNDTNEDLGLVWSGNATTNCKNWTSAVTSNNGVRGHATLTSANWLARDSAPCDGFARLVCICWSGGE